MSMIKLDQVSKIYNNDGVTAIGIQNISLEFNLGEFVAITGESGSGKSTLLNVISMMDSYEEGELFIDDKSTVDFTRQDFANYRANYVSFIFQEYNLVDSFSVLENVMLPLLSRGYSRKEAKKIALESIEKVGLTRVRRHKATHLSGGEKQRTVIARALVSNTPIIACDEPTGNLDSETAVQIINLLKEVSPGKLILYVTHDYDSIKDVATRHITMNDSHLESDTEIVQNNDVVAYENEKKARTKFPTILSLGLKDIFSTPKKSLLSFLIAFVISFSSLGILSGAFAIIVPASEKITTTEVTYADRNHFSYNRVVAFGKGDNNAELSSIETNDNVLVDYGSIIASQSYYTIWSTGGKLNASLECNEVNLVRDEDRLLPLLGEAPQSELDIALGISKKRYAKFVTEKDAYSFLRTKFLEQTRTTIIPSSIKSPLKDVSFKPCGVYLIDDINGADFTLLFSKDGLAKLRKGILTAFESNSNMYENALDPYEAEAVYSVGGIGIDFIPEGYNFVKDAAFNEISHNFDATKIYLSSMYEGFDLTISLRGAKITIAHDDERIIYSSKLSQGVYLHNAAFTYLFSSSKQTASFYAPNEISANAILGDLLGHSIMAYRSDTAQSINTSIHEEGYQNLLWIIVFSVVFVVSSLLIAFLGSLVLGAIYNSRKKDYAIFISLSFSQQAVRFINLVEMMFFFIFTSIISYTALILSSGIAGYNFYMASITDELGYAAYLQGFATVFNNIFSYVSSPVFIVVYFLFNVIFAVLVSTWIMNKFTRKTLANNLRKGGELL